MPVIINPGDLAVRRPVAVPASPSAASLASQVQAVKQEAARRILAVAPVWKQANLTARAAELALIYPAVHGSDLPEPERSEFFAGQAIWSRIRAIRDASNAIEAALIAADQAGDLMSVDIGLGWPD